MPLLLFFAHVEFKKLQCHMSLSFKQPVLSLKVIRGPAIVIDPRKKLCLIVDFSGQYQLDEMVDI